MIHELVARLGYTPCQEVKKKYGKNSAITIESLLEALINTRSVSEAAQKLKLSPSTLARLIKSVLPPSEGRTWHSFLPSLIGLKRCTQCCEFKAEEYFGIKSHSSNGIRSTCKDCTIIDRQLNKKKYNQAVRDNKYKDPDGYKARNAKYYARKVSAIPKWADVTAIKEIYAKCPEGCEVDHIIPLRGANVCGLHVETNLQYLTISENRAKSNKFVDS